MDDTPSRPNRPVRPERPLRRLLILATSATVVLAALIVFAVKRAEPWRRSGPPIVVSAWAPYWQTDSALASFTENAAVFGDLSLFAYHALAANVVLPYEGLGNGVADRYRNAAHQAGVKFTASIIDDTPGGTMAGILADPASRSTHVATIVALAGSGGFDGIDLDYEKFAFSDDRSTWTTTRPNWVAFVDELAAALHRAGKTLTVSAPPPTNYWVYDYASIGKVVDAIRIMAYDYSTSAAGPIAPIAWVRSVVADAKKLVPAGKLVLGVPVYGYDWPVDISGTCPGSAADQPRRRNLSSRSAAVLANSTAAVPVWDPTAAENTFGYTEQLSGVDANGAAVSCTVTHTVWYQDGRAAHERAWLAQRQDLQGIALWSLGSDDANVWAGIAAARANIAVWPAVTTPATASRALTAG